MSSDPPFSCGRRRPRPKSTLSPFLIARRHRSPSLSPDPLSMSTPLSRLVLPLFFFFPFSSRLEHSGDVFSSLGETDRSRQKEATLVSPFSPFFFSASPSYSSSHCSRRASFASVVIPRGSPLRIGVISSGLDTRFPPFLLPEGVNVGSGLYGLKDESLFFFSLPDSTNTNSPSFLLPPFFDSDGRTLVALDLSPLSPST